MLNALDSKPYFKYLHIPGNKPLHLLKADFSMFFVRLLNFFPNTPALFRDIIFSIY